jgi:lambda family phage portal protein
MSNLEQFSQLSRRYNDRLTHAVGSAHMLTRPLLYDANGLQIEASNGNGGSLPSGGSRVIRGNSGYLYGGTGYAQHGASFRKRALATWVPWTGSPDTDIVRNLPVLRGRSRDLYMSFPVARAAIDTKVQNVIGTGLRPMPLPDGDVLGITEEATVELSDLILREWRTWFEDELCDWDRQHSGYTKQAEIYRTKEMAGDAPLLFVYREDGRFPYELRLRTIDPDRIMNPYQIPYPTEKENVWGGIEMDGFNGPICAMWVAQFHPQDFGMSLSSNLQDWERIELFNDTYFVRNALLHMNIERPQQRRGVPPLAVALEMAKGLLRFTNEKINKEVITNMFAAFVTSPMPSEDMFRQMGCTEEQIMEFYRIFPYDIMMAPGGITFMKPGDSVTFANPPIGGTEYKVYQEINNIMLCAAIQVPYEIAIKHFSASYSASRAAIEEFSKSIRVDRQLCIDQVCQPIYENFIGELVLGKTLKFKKYFKDYRIRKALSRCLWTGISQGTIDPLKDIQAAMLRIQTGVSTVQRESMQANGSDWEENVLQLAKEKEWFEESGLAFLASAGAGASGVGAGGASKSKKQQPTEEVEEEKKEEEPSEPSEKTEKGSNRSVRETRPVRNAGE